jgi:hypothetical protein
VVAEGLDEEPIDMDFQPEDIAAEPIEQTGQAADLLKDNPAADQGAVDFDDWEPTLF